MSQSVLVIDLDGTLIRTDTFHEMLVKGLRGDPFLLFKVGLWLLIHDRAHAKELLVQRVSLDPQTLPYNEDLLEAIKDAKANGSRLVLATGTHHILAQKIADHVGLFDEVIATYDHINMTGENKARELVARYGEEGFIYAGDSRIDAKVWEHAREAWVVNPKWKVEEIAHQSGKPVRLFPRVISRPKAFMQAVDIMPIICQSRRTRSSYRDLIAVSKLINKLDPVVKPRDDAEDGLPRRSYALLAMTPVFVPNIVMRIIRWLVCSLIFVPLIWVGNQWFFPLLVLFIALCLLSSGASLFLNLKHIEGDREGKAVNPFAQGHLHLLTGLLWGPLFILAGFTLSFLCLSYVMAN